MSKIIKRALKILESRMTYETDFFNNPQDTKNYLRLKLGGNEREVFAVLYLSVNTTPDPQLFAEY